MSGNLYLEIKKIYEILDNWFKTAKPRWEVRWMIANAGENKMAKYNNG